MSSDDEIKRLLAEPGMGETRSAQARQKAQDKIASRVRGKQSQADILDFGFVKIWTILLEFLMMFYVRSQRPTVESKK